jgi:hypothetical protein
MEVGVNIFSPCKKRAHRIILKQIKIKIAVTLQGKTFSEICCSQ